MYVVFVCLSVTSSLFVDTPARSFPSFHIAFDARLVPVILVWSHKVSKRDTGAGPETSWFPTVLSSMTN